MEDAGTLQAPATYLHPGARGAFYKVLIFEDPGSHPVWNSGL